MTEERIHRLEQEIELIRQRNARVEADKAWETSSVRIVCICLVTYIIAACVMWAIGAKRFWLDAFVPVVGFFLSSRTLRGVKTWWLRNSYKRAEREQLDCPTRRIDSP